MNAKLVTPAGAALLVLGLAFLSWPLLASASEPSQGGDFPLPVDQYADLAGASLLQTLIARVQQRPFNLVATLIFFLAIAHTFAAPLFLKLSHRFEREHQERLAQRTQREVHAGRQEVSFKAAICHFLGEVEAVFGIWVIPLILITAVFKGWPVARDYIGHHLVFTEPLFVLVIMTIAASRPILMLAEQLLGQLAGLGGRTPMAWWFSILTVGPLLGSFITEPAAMTICALLLARKIYSRKPSPALAYGTLGLLFVNVSVGGTLTHFAAPPVLMVAGKWGWGFSHMLMHFGVEAGSGILTANLVYLLWFRKELGRLASAPDLSDEAVQECLARPVPVWITCVHILFLAWTVMNNHYPALFMGGFLFYLAFTQATEHHQDELALRPALLVAFFLAGLVVHGGLQGWWISPLLTRLGELPLFFGAAFLTSFNDNAAITYLASLVPNFSPELKHAVVAGAVAGGGLTVIANAPNPAGHSILSRFFPEGISALRLLLGALVPTALVCVYFVLFK
jgi:hypothetical protein